MAQQLHLRSTKRQKLVLSSIGLGAVMGLAIYWPLAGWSLLPVLALSYGAVVWTLDFDLRGREWAVLPLYILLASGIAFMGIWQYAHLPIYRWGGVVVYGLVSYGLLLTLNVLNVATVRNLPLARQALTIISLAGLVGLFCLFYLLLLHQPTAGQWVASTATITALASWPLIWSARLGQISITAELGWTALVTWLGVQLAVIVIVWPISYMTSLVMAGGISVIVGLIHQYLARQLTKSLQQQYLLIGGAMLLLLYAFSSWV